MKNDDVEGVIQHLPNASLKHITRAVSHAIECDTFNALRALLTHMPTKTHQNMWMWLLDAVLANKTDAVEVLATCIHPKYKDIALHATLHNACIHGKIDAVRCLVQYTPPKFNNCEALLSAAHHGYADIVEFLIPLSDPLVQSSNALRLAASNNHLKCFELLLPHSSMQDFERYQTITLIVDIDGRDFLKSILPQLSAKAITDGMISAFQKGRNVCIDILFDYCVPSEIQAHLPQHEHAKWNACVERCTTDRAQKLKMHITNQIDERPSNPTSKTTRKM